MTLKSYLNRAEASEHLTKRGLPITKNGLQKAAVRGDGPPYRLWGIMVVYQLEDLDAWAAEKLGAPVNSTSEITRRRGRKPVPPPPRRKSADEPTESATD